MKGHKQSSGKKVVKKASSHKKVKASVGKTVGRPRSKTH